MADVVACHRLSQQSSVAVQRILCVQFHIIKWQTVIQHFIVYVHYYLSFALEVLPVQIRRDTENASQVFDSCAYPDARSSPASTLSYTPSEYTANVGVISYVL